MTDTVEVYKDDAGEWRWRRQAANGEIVATSGEGYVNMKDCVDEAVKVNGIMGIEYPAPSKEDLDV